MKRVGIIVLFLLVITLLIGQDIKMYPNPIHEDGNLTIESDSLLPPVIKVYNFSGVLVKRVDIGYGNSEVVISFLGLSKGVYVIWLEDY